MHVQSFAETAVSQSRVAVFCAKGAMSVFLTSGSRIKKRSNAMSGKRFAKLAASSHSKAVEFAVSDVGVFGADDGITASIGFSRRAPPNFPKKKPVVRAKNEAAVVAV